MTLRLAVVVAPRLVECGMPYSLELVVIMLALGMPYYCYLPYSYRALVLHHGRSGSSASNIPKLNASTVTSGNAPAVTSPQSNTSLSRSTSNASTKDGKTTSTGTPGAASGKRGSESGTGSKWRL